MSTKVKKVTKKATTAKGKGKPAKAKVVKKTATKKAAVKKAVKKVTKKAVAKKVTDPYAFKNPSKTNPYPYFRYGNVSVSDVSNEKYPELVMITAGPSRYEAIIGKKYINKDFAIRAINAEQAENLIGKGKKAVDKELDAIGLLPMETPETEEAEK